MELGIEPGTLRSPGQCSNHRTVLPLFPSFLTFCSNERSIPTHFLNFEFLVFIAYLHKYISIHKYISALCIRYTVRFIHSIVIALYYSIQFCHGHSHHTRSSIVGLFREISAKYQRSFHGRGVFWWNHLPTAVDDVA